MQARLLGSAVRRIRCCNKTLSQQRRAAAQGLTTLKMGWCKLGAEEGAQALADLLMFNTTLAAIDLRGNGLGDAGAPAVALYCQVSVLAHYLLGHGARQSTQKGNKNTLASFDLRGNGLGDASAPASSISYPLNIPLPHCPAPLCPCSLRQGGSDASPLPVAKTLDSFARRRGAPGTRAAGAHQ